jgi:hypothetical protein
MPLNEIHYSRTFIFSLYRDDRAGYTVRTTHWAGNREDSHDHNTESARVELKRKTPHDDRDHHQHATAAPQTSRRTDDGRVQHANRRDSPSPNPNQSALTIHTEMRKGGDAGDDTAPPVMTVVGVPAPNSTDKTPRAMFGVVQQCERVQDNVMNGKPEWRVRLAALAEDLDSVDEFGTVHRIQIGGSYVKNASELVYPVDYTRDKRGRYIVYTTARQIHDHVHSLARPFAS